MKKHLSQTLVSIILMSVAFGAGCAVVQPLINPAVGVAACATVQKYPESARYVSLAGDTFTAFGKSTPPTPADLADALSKIPGAAINGVYAAAAWQGAVVAYEGVYALAKTPEQKAKLSTVLSGIGTALTSAAISCGPVQPTTKALALQQAQDMAPTATILDLSKAIEQQFKRK